jgi:hypothetical protein
VRQVSIERRGAVGMGDCSLGCVAHSCVACCRQAVRNIQQMHVLTVTQATILETHKKHPRALYVFKHTVLQVGTAFRSIVLA